MFNDKAISYIKSAFCGRAYDNFYYTIKRASHERKKLVVTKASS